MIMWVFYRALSLHLQICWEVVPGKIFHAAALLGGWGLPAIFLAIALSLTGVSFRFGNVCHINHDNGLADFWGPLLGFAALALVIQTVTMIFCIHVYVKSLLDDNTTTDTSSALPSYQGSVRTVTARQAYRRVKKIIALQWRGIAIVLIIIALVVFFSVVFVSLDSNLTSATKNNSEKLEPWLLCLVFNAGDKNKCLKEVSGAVTNEATILAVLICLAVSPLNPPDPPSDKLTPPTRAPASLSSSSLAVGQWFKAGSNSSATLLAVENVNSSPQTPDAYQRTTDQDHTRCFPAPVQAISRSPNPGSRVQKMSTPQEAR